MTEELKPCPLCGAGATISFADNAGIYTIVNCIMCGCRTGKKPKQSQAVTAWNTRTPDTSAKVDVEYYKDTVKCMSNVLTDLANMLGTRQGEPDYLFDAIEELQEKAALQAPRSDTSAVELVRELLTAITFGSESDLPNNAGRGYMARIPSGFVTKAEAWLKKVGE